MSAGKYRVRIQVEDQFAHRQLVDIVSRMNQFQLQEEGDTERSDLLIIEVNEDQEETFARMQSLFNSGEVGEVFLISSSTDQNILINAIRAGAREFFGPSTEEADVAAALERFLVRQSRARAVERPDRSSQLLTVMGSKGGVGTTTIAVNLAVSLAAKENRQSVVLLDMNMFGDIPLFLEIEPSYTWREITKNISRLDSTFLKNILSVDPSGVYVLPSPGYLDNQSMATPETIERLLKVTRKMFDFIIVDLGQTLNDATLKFLALSDRVLLVSIQSLPCLAKTHKLMRTFQDLGYPEDEHTHIILNRFLEKSNIGIRDVEQSLGRKLFWTLPNDYAATISAINKGQPLLKTAPRKEITTAFMELSSYLVSGDKTEENSKKRRWWPFGRQG